jgi:ankyrin repeat protein
MATVSALIKSDASLDVIVERARSHPDEAIAPRNPLHAWPMRYAIWKKRHDVMEALFALNRKTVSTRRWYTTNLLDLAVNLEDARAIRLLYGMNRRLFSQQNGIGDTPLDTAICNSKVTGIYTIIQLNKESLNSRSVSTGYTPVETAAFAGRADIVELLISLGSTSWQSSFPLSVQRRTDLKDHVAKIFHAIGYHVSRTPIYVSIEEEEDVRYRIYFATPLLHRLLFDLE